ncbi:phospho-N-acetylmuramoyl-pentapeptide-transferase [Haloferula luteola]|uniref:Phospho-N-acetylmuramoyl-pentapeptide-transferase n=1 Tax=Haloferula luteola TaxID=595692 RepID=A0A840VDP6_9BACT|nr:phospho-N-acetylmuramoyl-pentapeptide-transferase [Haloferula luteola]MBB5351949.1 phospho-N-acetylmuramoyl-pentapeptide-transferase [Haloferula luteola]
MLYWIYEWWRAAFESEVSANQEGWAHALSFFNLLQYITFRAALGCLMAFALSILFGPRVIRRLISLKVGQPIRTAEEVHKLAELHGGKVGTPTMGGVLILGSVLISTFICARPFNPFVAVCACSMGALGLLGFMDDFTKVKKKNSDGVSARTKLFWQLVVALVASCFLYFKMEISGFGSNPEVVKNLGYVPGYQFQGEPLKISQITFPLFKQPLMDLGFLIIPFYAAIIIGCSNAVNLTDGLDGLATGCTITVSLAYAGLAYLAGHHFMANEYLTIPYNRFISELSVFLLALAGASFGFLWFNCHPAKVFMGDTGSLAIGGALGTAALCVKQELLLVIIGGVFVMEAMSVMLQVGSFKLRRKRIFAMAPIHHHFELRGWHESQVIIRFWILSIMLALFGLALLKIV